MSENPRPPDWDEERKKAIAELGMLPPQTEFPIIIPDSFDWFRLKSQLYDTGADAIYPFALEKGKAEGKVSLIKELLAKDTTIFMGTGSELHIVSERNVAVSWKSKEPGYLAFIPIKL